METFLKELNFVRAEATYYEPHKVISKQRLEKNKFVYDFQPILEWEKEANNESWTEIEEVYKI